VQSARAHRANDPLASVFDGGRIQGWTSHSRLPLTQGQPNEEEKSPAAADAGALSSRSEGTMLMLVSKQMQQASARAASPPRHAAVSPYLAQPPSAQQHGATANPSGSFPHEIHSAQLAALAAEFNTHAGSGLLVSAARPRTAQRWQAAGGSAAASQQQQQLQPHASTKQPLSRRERAARRSHSQYDNSSEIESRVVMPAHGIPVVTVPAAPAPLAPKLRGPLATAAGFSLMPSVPSIPRARSDLASRHDSEPLGPSSEGSVWARGGSAQASASHWNAQPAAAIPPPESSRWREAAPFQPIHPAQQPRHCRSTGPGAGTRAGTASASSPCARPARINACIPCGECQRGDCCCQIG